MNTIRINVLLVVSIVLTIFSALVTHYAAKESSRRVDIVMKSEEVIRVSGTIVFQLKACELYYRDYLLFHEQTQLENFERTSHDIEGKFVTLRALVTDSAQIDLLETTIAPVVRSRLATLRESMESAAAVSTIEDLRSRRSIYYYTNQLQEHMVRFRQREESLLTAKMGVLQEALDSQRIVRYVCFFLIGLTSLLALIRLTRKRRRIDKLIQQLNTTNETLEDKIKERTIELERKNALTEKLNRDLQENFQTLELFYEALQVKNIKTQDTLREIQYLYDNANCGYHSLDPNGVFIRINQTELTWLGYKREEVVHRLTFKDILVPEEHEIFNTKFPQFLRERSLMNMKYHYRRKDGSSFPVLLYATAIYDNDGNFIMSRTTVVDNTEQEEAEKKLIDFNQRLQALNEEKNSFLGAAAHDLKSPLNGVLGLIQLFKRKTDNLTIEQQEYLRYVEQSCTSMKMMITNLLDINRIEQGTNMLSPAHFSLRSLLQQQMKLFKEASDRKNIAMVLEDNHDEIFMYSDPALVERISDNLISNALKFSFPKGSVWITVTQANSHVTLQVKDRGPGISKDEIGLLFNKFKKLTPRPTAGESSTGLGLSIVKELVQLLRGRIYVDSEEKVGTTFIVELPVSMDGEEIKIRSEV
jgi:PAS domain S-box-containing protein